MLTILNSGEWFPVPNLAGSFVVNFGNAFEAATEGAVRATIHRVQVWNAVSLHNLWFFLTREGTHCHLQGAILDSVLPGPATGPDGAPDPRIHPRVCP